MISSAPDKKAETLVNHLAKSNITDPYHYHIYGAAHKLSRLGLGDYVYQNQYPSGTTLWEHPERGAIMVTPDGTIF
jgi:hypothetical protein